MSEENNNVQNNFIDQLSVRDLLDGRMFYIPSYQRGYRWTKRQIYDLCNDLLEYALKPKEFRKSEENPDELESYKAFYSLQPLIVKQAVHKIKNQDTPTLVYEVIDGQQRLTSIYVLYRAVMNAVNLHSNKELKDNRGVSLYHIYYQTRPDDYDFIEDLGFKTIKNSDIKDIDIAHLVNAYYYIQQWLSNDPETDRECAKATWMLFAKKKNDFSKFNVANKLFNLLNNDKDTDEPEGNVQFIWYQIGDQKDPIQEFLSENKGKIQLTNTEKIRGLFMRRKSSDAIGNMIQLNIAKDWELIENTLHRNDFWAFISNDTEKEDGRIDIIFQYLYERDCKNKEYDGGDKVFRYYYQLFNNRSNDPALIVEEWNKVMEAFRMLQNWYQNPRIYNWVGLLTKEGEANITTKVIADIYDDPAVISTEDFILRLKKKVCEVIVNKIPISNKGNKELEFKESEEDRFINLFFNNPSEKKKIPGLLRFINVNLLCKQIDKLLEDVDRSDEEKRKSDMGRSVRDEKSRIYRFPFEALDAFKWDVEHIDSATTNTLTNPKEQNVWIDESEEALGDALTSQSDYIEQKESRVTATDDLKPTIVSNMIRIIKTLIGEGDSEEQKNWIGNLTLLDSGTNRIYKNKIFALKREILRERINRGIFTPVCTQNIFNKIFIKGKKNFIRWDLSDKKAYHNFILKEVEDFVTKYKEDKEAAK